MTAKFPVPEGGAGGYDVLLAVIVLIGLIFCGGCLLKNPNLIPKMGLAVSPLIALLVAFGVAGMMVWIGRPDRPAAAAAPRFLN